MTSTEAVTKAREWSDSHLPGGGAALCELHKPAKSVGNLWVVSLQNNAGRIDVSLSAHTSEVEKTNDLAGLRDYTFQGLNLNMERAK